MSTPATAFGVSSLPLWDTYEAAYFFAAGLFAGIVLGFLFPSLWRTLRRRFRNAEKYAFDDVELHASSAALRDDDDDPAPRPVEAQLVHARGLVQSGHVREGISAYVTTLKDAQVSKGQTNAALFELAQAYQLLGLNARAFEIATELLHRRPRSLPVMNLALRLVESTDAPLETILSAWKGTTPEALRRRISHRLCTEAERTFRAGRLPEAEQMARRAVRWDIRAARPRILLWSAPRQTPLQAEPIPALLEVRLRIDLETGVSPAAGADVLHALLTAAVEPDPAVAGATLREGLARAFGEEFRTDRLAALALMALLQPPANSAVRRLASGLAPELDDFLARFPMYTPLVQTGLLAHRCQACGTRTSAFGWQCPGCGALEQLQPVVPAPWLGPREIAPETA